MANLLGEIGGTLDTYFLSGLGTIVTFISIFLLVIIFFVGLFIFLWWKGFNYKVKIYEPIGQVQFDDNELVAMKFEKDPEENLKKLKEKNIKFDYIRMRRTHGKYTTIKGAQYFQTFLPMRKVPPIPMTMLYDDGVHLVRLSRDILVPIPKPNTSLEVGKNVSITVEEDIQWKTWNNMMADRVNNKYQDLDAQRKIAFYFIAGIVAIILIGGFIIYLIFRMSMKGLEFDERLTQVAQGIIGGKSPS